MYFARLLLILLPQLLAFSSAQDLQGNSITPTTMAYKSTTNIFEKYLTKSRAAVENTTRSTTTEGVWFKTTSTSTVPTTKSTLVTILTTNTTIPTTTTLITETTGLTLGAITIPTTTEAKSSPTTTTAATTIRSTKTLSTISSTKSTTSKKSKTIPTSTQSHAHHVGHKLSTSTIDSTVKSELTSVPNGCKNFELHWSVSAVIFVALGSVYF